jgi:hypothetical protein
MAFKSFNLGSRAMPKSLRADPPGGADREGMPLFDNLDLEAVAAEAARRNRWEFLLMAAPLAVETGTGSPLNPLAVF